MKEDRRKEQRRKDERRSDQERRQSDRRQHERRATERGQFDRRIGERRSQTDRRFVERRSDEDRRQSENLSYDTEYNDIVAGRNAVLELLKSDKVFNSQATQFVRNFEKVLNGADQTNDAEKLKATLLKTDLGTIYSTINKHV